MLVCKYCHLVLADNESTCPRDGGQGIEFSNEPLESKLYERFKDVQPFAQGMTSSLYSAEDLVSGRRGLLKVLRFEQAPHTTKWSRIIRDLEKQKTLTDQHVAPIFDAGDSGPERETGNFIWLLRPLIEGQSLAAFLKKEHTLEVPVALAIVAQIATGLDAIHRTGLLHRDLKPGHVILHPQTSAVPIVTLIDTGVAAPIETKSLFDLVGTAAYISPECASGKAVSFRSDLYALGCILYEMLAGEPPFIGEEVDDLLRSHQEQPVTPLSLQLPDPVAALVTSLLSKEPRGRPFSAQQVRRTLEPFLPESTPAARISHSLRPLAPKAVSEPPPKTAAASTQRRSVPPPSDKSPRRTTVPPPSRNTRPSAPPPPAAPTQKRSVPPPPDMRVRSAVPGIDGSAGDTQVEELHTEDLAVDPAFSANLEAIGASGGVGSKAITSDVDDDVTQLMSEKLIMLDEQGVLPRRDGAPKKEIEASGGRADSGREDSETDTDKFNKLEQMAAVLSSRRPGPVQSAISDPGSGAQTVKIQGAQPLLSNSVESSVSSNLLDSDPVPDEEGTLLIPVRRWSQPRMMGIAAAVTFAVALTVYGALRWLEEPHQQVTVVGTKTPSAMSLTKVASAPVAVTPQLTPASPVAPVVNEPVAQPLAKTEETPKSADVANKPIDQQKLRRERESSATARDMADSSRKSDVRKGRGISKLSSGASIAKRAPSAESIKEKAREYFQAGKFAAAAAAYKEASRLDPSNAGSFAGLGASLVAANDTDGAIAAYQRAIQLSPKTSGYHAALGRTYFTKGDRARAIKAYKKALEVDPNNRVAQAALARLGR